MKKKNYSLAWVCLLTLTASLPACDEDSSASSEAHECGSSGGGLDYEPTGMGPEGEPKGPDAVPLPGETIVELSVSVTPDPDDEEVHAMIEFETADGRGGTIHYIQGDHTTVEISDRHRMLVAIDTNVGAIQTGGPPQCGAPATEPAISIPDEEAFVDSLEVGVLAVVPDVLEIALEDEALAAITWQQQPQGDCADNCGLAGEAVGGIGTAVGGGACAAGLGPTPAGLACAAGAAAIWIGAGWLTSQGCQAVAC